jgi:hypothetical protein
LAVVQSAIAVADRELAAPSAPAAGARGDLLKLFASVSDGRSGQGRDHPVAAVLARAAAAVLAGMKGYTAIAGWVKDVPSAVLDLAQVVLDRARADERPRADLRVRQPFAGQPRDLGLLGGQLAGGLASSGAGEPWLWHAAANPTGRRRCLGPPLRCLHDLRHLP